MKKVEIRDILKYRFPSNLQYSPDGTVLAYQQEYADEEKNDYHADVHIIRNGRDIQLTSTLNASLLLWDDNSHLILKRNTADTKPGMCDLYRIDADGGEAVKWLSLPVSAGKMKKAGENTYVFTGTIDRHHPDLCKSSEEEREKYREKEKKEKDYQVVDELPYWLNGAGFTNGKRTALFVLKTDPFSLERVTDPDFDTAGFEIKDSSVYYFGSAWQNHQPLTSDLYRYDLNEKKIHALYDHSDRSIADLFFLNGKLFVQETDMKEYGVNETCQVAEVTEGGFRQLFKPEYSLYSSVVGDTLPEDGKNHVPAGNKILFNTTVEDHNELKLFDENIQEKTILVKSGQIGDLACNGEKITFTYQGWDHPGEIHEADLNGQNEKVLTHMNDPYVKDVYVAKPQKLDYTSGEDSLHGWVLLPEDFDETKQYPAVLDVHGGPRCVYSEGFFHEMQVWASKGYVVMFTNIRGSDGRGDAFADIRDQYGFADYQNLMDFVDAVLAEYPNIDQTKLCETGGSYGGFMSNWILTHTDRFCAIASQRSISNWVSMSLISDIGPYFGPDQCGAEGLFGKKNTELLWKHSPLAFAENAKTPTLFIHSDEDYRCPLAEGMQMMQALASQNIETRMCIFHGENHELSRSGKPLHRVRRLQEISDWFDKHTDRREENE